MIRKRFVLFFFALMAAALIVGASLEYRKQRGTNNDEIVLISGSLTPSPLPTGLLEQQLGVPFPGSETAVLSHDFFPLTGSHANLACAACHGDGVFEGSGTDCIDCHAEEDIHNGNNGLNCMLCHTPTQWQNASFDHGVIGQRDCAECHNPPANHFPGACSSCHMDTTSFRNASFDHSFIGNTDCAACHSPPANHFPGACSSCHMDTTSFLNASFDHSFIGNTDCAACHSPPANHFPGACSSCHMDTTSFRNASFSHSFPLNHGEANGQCSTCHTGNVTAVFTCSACHNREEMDEEHADKDIFNINNCVACHADGEKPDDD